MNPFLCNELNMAFVFVLAVMKSQGVGDKSIIGSVHCVSEGFYSTQRIMCADFNVLVKTCFKMRIPFFSKRTNKEKIKIAPCSLLA